MIKIENYEVVGWEAAIRGMRNPMNSWDKSDSCYKCPYGEVGCEGTCTQNIVLGPNDKALMEKLRNAGADHRKYMRYLEVYVDITAPLYWWKEFKTYRHGRKFMDDDDIFEYDDDMLEYHIETNSCSTMHRIHEKEFTLDDFSHEHLIGSSLEYINDLVHELNAWRSRFLATKNKEDWWQLIQLLPNSYNQKRTVKLSYECLARMYHSRKNHKQDEWIEFCKWIETLPYSEIITKSKDADEYDKGFEAGRAWVNAKIYSAYKALQDGFTEEALGYLGELLDDHKEVTDDES